MSERQSKHFRRVNNAEQALPPVMEVKIQVFQGGRIEVLGFPSNYLQALDVMQAGIARLSTYFIQMARDGKVDGKFNLEQPQIVKPGLKDIEAIGKA
jgi:hypothetical protein